MDTTNIDPPSTPPKLNQKKRRVFDETNQFIPSSPEGFSFASAHDEDSPVKEHKRPVFERSNPHMNFPRAFPPMAAPGKGRGRVTPTFEAFQNLQLKKKDDSAKGGKKRRKSVKKLRKKKGGKKTKKSKNTKKSKKSKRKTKKNNKKRK